MTNELGIIQLARPNRELLFLMNAMLFSLRGTCQRAKVGAVIVLDKRIISAGYNGSIPGGHHCDSETCTPDEPCKNAIHAEANAIYFAAKKGIALEGSTIYCTHSPCPKCSEAIIQAGIKEVVYLKEYRNTNFELFREVKIRKTEYGASIYPYFQNLASPGASSTL